MKYNFSNLKIAARLKLGFGIVVALVVINTIFTFFMLKSNRGVVDEINSVHNPSLVAISNLYNQVNDSKMLIKNWVFVEQKTGTIDKLRLVELHKAAYPQLVSEINIFKSKWDSIQITQIDRIKLSIDSLYKIQEDIMLQLNSIEKYADPMISMTIIPDIDENGSLTVLTERIKGNLSILSNSLKVEREKK